MATPLPTAKQSIDLASAAVRGSKIRRDPAPAMKEITIVDRDERDTRMVIIGIIAFALALLIIGIGFASVSGWSATQYVWHV